jgi:hypothetical protein
MIQNAGKNRELEWHVGEKPPRTRMGEHKNRNSEDIQVLECYADGDELEHIKHAFHDFPVPKTGQRSCTWRGDLARFVWDNL